MSIFFIFSISCLRRLIRVVSKFKSSSVLFIKMKFAFKIVIICAGLSSAFAQFWNLFPSSYPNSYPSSYPNSYPESYPNSRPNSYQNSYPNRNSENSITQESSQPTSLSLNSCESYWTLQNDGNGVWGQLSITSPNREQAIIKVILTLAAALPTVSN